MADNKSDVSSQSSDTVIIHDLPESPTNPTGYLQFGESTDSAEDAKVSTTPVIHLERPQIRSPVSPKIQAGKSPKSGRKALKLGKLGKTPKSSVMTRSKSRAMRPSSPIPIRGISPIHHSIGPVPPTPGTEAPFDTPFGAFKDVPTLSSESLDNPFDQIPRKKGRSAKIIRTDCFSCRPTTSTTTTISTPQASTSRPDDPMASNLRQQLVISTFEEDPAIIEAARSQEEPIDQHLSSTRIDEKQDSLASTVNFNPKHATTPTLEAELHRIEQLWEAEKDKLANLAMELKETRQALIERDQKVEDLAIHQEQEQVDHEQELIALRQDMERRSAQYEEDINQLETDHFQNVAELTAQYDACQVKITSLRNLIKRKDLTHEQAAKKWAEQSQEHVGAMKLMEDERYAKENRLERILEDSEKKAKELTETIRRKSLEKNIQIEELYQEKTDYESACIAKEKELDDLQAEYKRNKKELEEAEEARFYTEIHNQEIEEKCSQLEEELKTTQAKCEEERQEWKTMMDTVQKQMMEKISSLKNHVHELEENKQRQEKNTAQEQQASHQGSQVSKSITYLQPEMGAQFQDIRYPSLGENNPQRADTSRIDNPLRQGNNPRDNPGNVTISSTGSQHSTQCTGTQRDYMISMPSTQAVGYQTARQPLNYDPMAQVHAPSLRPAAQVSQQPALTLQAPNQQQQIPNPFLIQQGQAAVVNPMQPGVPTPMVNPMTQGLPPTMGNPMTQGQMPMVNPMQPGYTPGMPPPTGSHAIYYHQPGYFQNKSPPPKKMDEEKSTSVDQPPTEERSTVRRGRTGPYLKPFEGLPRKFTGEGKFNSCPVAHLECLKDYFWAHQIEDDDAEKLNRFKMSLEGPARVWIGELKAESFAEAARKFVKLYAGVGTYRATEDRMRGIRWKEGDSLETYRQQLSTLAEAIGQKVDVKTGKLSEQFKSQFIRGLPSDYQESLENLEVEECSIDNIMHKVKRREARKLERRGYKSTAKVAWEDTALAIEAAPSNTTILKPDLSDITGEISSEIKETLSNVLTSYAKEDNKEKNRSKYSRKDRSRSRDSRNKSYYRSQSRDRSRSRSRSRGDSKHRGNSRDNSRYRSNSRGRDRDSSRIKDRQPTPGPNGRRSFNPAEAECFHCKQKGHTKNRCKVLYEEMHQYFHPSQA
jgi:hypothetical protein